MFSVVLERMSIFALGIMPYIAHLLSCSCCLYSKQYLRLKKEGEAGRRKISQYTRYATVALVAQAWVYRWVWLAKALHLPQASNSILSL